MTNTVENPAQDARKWTIYNQNIQDGATPVRSTVVTATAVQRPSSQEDPTTDWRVSLKVPSEIRNDTVFAPFVETGNRMIFPVNPTVILSQTASYQSIAPTHTNYAFHAYQNSQINDIVITGDFFVQNNEDAKYWVACIHFLRTMTKMFYANSNPQGNPPLVTRLNGYGDFVLNNIPVLITNFTVDMVNDVDYVPCDPLGDGKITYAPTQSQFSVTCAPNYSRRTHSMFDLKKFADGGFTGGSEGFV